MLAQRPAAGKRGGCRRRRRVAAFPSEQERGRSEADHRVIGLAIGTPERKPMAPDVPTAAEVALPEWPATAWTPWSATLGRPLSLRRFLHEQIAEVRRQPDGRERIIALGNTIPEGMTPQATRVFSAAEIERWVPILRASGARVN